MVPTFSYSVGKGSLVSVGSCKGFFWQEVMYISLLFISCVVQLSLLLGLGCSGVPDDQKGYTGYAAMVGSSAALSNHQWSDSDFSMDEY